MFFFEFNQDGRILRQVEFVGAQSTVVGAAAAEEWWSCQEWTRQPSTPATVAYESRYGRVGEGSLDDFDDDYEPQPLSAEAFEEVWRFARANL